MAVDDGVLQGEKNGSSGWWQWGEPVVGGGDGWQQLMVVYCKEKNFQFFFVPNDLKSPKNNMSFLFLTTFGGGLVCQKQMCLNPNFF